MLNTFLSHQWKSFWRSRNKAGSVAAQVVLGFFILYFLLAAVVVGFGMKGFIEKLMPGQNPEVVFSGFVLYYFLVDLMMRIQLQELPTISIVPYLHLKISRSRIVNFLNLKSLFTFFNLLPLFIFLPFIILNIGSSHGLGAVIGYALSIVSLVLFNNFLVLYIKRRAISSVTVFGVGVGVIFAFIGLDFYQIISIRDFSNWVFQAVISYPWLSLVIAAAAYAIFAYNSAYLRANLYTEELSTKDDKKVSTDYPFLNRFGSVGQLAALELKLILRHKRSRNSLIMGLFFLAYGLMFYKKEFLDKDQFGMMLFAGIFMTGIFVVNYGQFMFAWQSTHFDGILVSKINFKDFIKAKFLLFTLGSTIIAVLSSLYGLMSYKLLLLHFVAYVYNLGVGTVIVLYFSNFNYKRLDISGGASFNWQGVGATQWLLGLPLLAVPLLIYMPFGILNKPYWGLITLAALGILGLILRNFFVDLIVSKFEKQRYKIAEGFRE
jgi:hypothetical protein